MATTAFKNWINLVTIAGMAGHFSHHDPSFDTTHFIATASHNLESLALKQRTQQVTLAMFECLPKNFILAAGIIRSSLGPELGKAISGGAVDERGIGGWSVMALADYVAQFGLDFFDVSMALLQDITQRGSAEFAIRFFLEHNQVKTLAALESWIDHPDHHVRRLVSEGTRPMLPWGFQLKALRADPWPALSLLEQLKDDESEYVRRSVANHLNDIAKDHPNTVADIATRWLTDAQPNRVRLIRHGCRTLLKQDHPRVLSLFGYSPAVLQSCSLTLDRESLAIGENLVMTLSFEASEDFDEQILMIDYCVHHQKANGQTSPKVFKWRVVKTGRGTCLTFHKKHAFKAITTRRYYPGKHLIEVKINGEVLAAATCELLNL